MKMTPSPPNTNSRAGDRVCDERLEHLDPADLDEGISLASVRQAVKKPTVLSSARYDLSPPWTHCVECGLALVLSRDKMMLQGLCSACAPISDVACSECGVETGDVVEGLCSQCRFDTAPTLIRSTPLSLRALRDHVARRAGVGPEDVPYAVVHCEGPSMNPPFGERGIEELVRKRAARWASRLHTANRALSIDERWCSLGLVGPLCLGAVVVGTALYAPAHVFVISLVTFGLAVLVAWRASLAQTQLETRRQDRAVALSTSEVYCGLVATLDAHGDARQVFAQSQEIEKNTAQGGSL